jgi:hypothetical protein
MMDADLASFLAFFAARFSFKVFPCFLLLAFCADLLAMTTFLVPRTYPAVAGSTRTSRLRDKTHVTSHWGVGRYGWHPGNGMPSIPGMTQAYTGSAPATYSACRS